MVNLLKGDILATTGPGLTLMAGVFGAVALLLMVFRKEFLLVSFDRDLAGSFREARRAVGQPALPDNWCHHLARGHDRRPHG